MNFEASCIKVLSWKLEITTKTRSNYSLKGLLTVRTIKWLCWCLLHDNINQQDKTSCNDHVIKTSYKINILDGD